MRSVKPRTKSVVASNGEFLLFYWRISRRDPGKHRYRGVLSLVPKKWVHTISGSKNPNWDFLLWQRGVVYMTKDIDREFEEFVQKNYHKLTENQKQMCKKLGINNSQWSFLLWALDFLIGLVYSSSILNFIPTALSINSALTSLAPQKSFRKWTVFCWSKGLQL